MPEDHVRYARNDLMGLVREDLGYDMARHVDSTVHMFDEWGLPMMKDKKTGRYQREGKWQIMIPVSYTHLTLPTITGV